MQQAHEIRAIRSGLIIPHVSSGSPDIPWGLPHGGPGLAGAESAGSDRADRARPPPFRHRPRPPAPPRQLLGSSPTREPRPYRLSTLGMALARSASSAREGFDRRSRARVRVVITNVRDSTVRAFGLRSFGDLHRPLRSITSYGIP